MNKKESRERSVRNGVECLYCDERGHVKAECFQSKRDKSKHNANKKDEEDKTLVAITRTDEQPPGMARTPSHIAFIDSGATEQIINDTPVITYKVDPLDFTLGTTGKDTIKGTAQGGLVI